VLQPGRDVSGAAIALFTARLHHPSQTSHQAVLNALIFQLDVTMERFCLYFSSAFSANYLWLAKRGGSESTCETGLWSF